MAPPTSVQPDLTLMLDMDGVIREATLSSAMAHESVEAWHGRPWAEIAGEAGADKVGRMIEDARHSGISAFRQINQRFPSGAEIPMEFTTVLLGGRAGMLVVGKNLRAVAELQSRLIAAQQTMERDYWKLREIETRYRLVFDASDEAVLIVSAATLRVLEANRAAVEALNATRRRNENPAGRELLQDVAAKDRDAVRDMLARIRERGKALSILVHLGAEARPWMLRGSLINADSGPAFLLQFTAVAAPAHDGEAGNGGLEGLVDQLPDGFVALDAGGVITDANRAFLDLVQVGAKGTVVGESLSRWLWQPGADLNALLTIIAQQGSVRMFTTSIRGELGADTEIEISAAAAEDGAEGRPIGVLLRNISRRLPSASEADLLRTSLGPLTEQIGKSSLRKLVKNTVSVVEQHYVKQALELAKGNRTATAELLGLSRQSLYAKLNLYGLEDKGAVAGEPSED